MPCKAINNKSGLDLAPHQDLIDSFFPYTREKLKYDQDFTLNLLSDTPNQENALGKTAYYNPEAYEITIYVDGRHIKDILRSISHEIVHHTQNCRGEFKDGVETGDGYAQGNSHLRKMEKEAYLQGNMLFRDWEDNYKRDNTLKENKIMNINELRELVQKQVQKMNEDSYRGDETEIRGYPAPAEKFNIDQWTADAGKKLGALEKEVSAFEKGKQRGSPARRGAKPPAGVQQYTGAELFGRRARLAKAIYTSENGKYFIYYKGKKAPASRSQTAQITRAIQKQGGGTRTVDFSGEGSTITAGDGAKRAVDAAWKAAGGDKLDKQLDLPRGQQRAGPEAPATGERPATPGDLDQIGKGVPRYGKIQKIKGGGARPTRSTNESVMVKKIEEEVLRILKEKKNNQSLAEAIPGVSAAVMGAGLAGGVAVAAAAPWVMLATSALPPLMIAGGVAAAGAAGLWVAKKLNLPGTRDLKTEIEKILDGGGGLKSTDQAARFFSSQVDSMYVSGEEEQAMLAILRVIDRAGGKVCASFVKQLLEQFDPDVDPADENSVYDLWFKTIPLRFAHGPRVLARALLERIFKKAKKWVKDQKKKKKWKGCPDGQRFDAVTGKCVPEKKKKKKWKGCPDGQRFDAVAGKCVPDGGQGGCPDGQRFDGPTGKCVPDPQPPGPHRRGGRSCKHPRKGGVLSKGCVGLPVEDIQNRLNTLYKKSGYSLDADGKFGRNTENMVVGFQRQHKLQPDGKFGPKSWAALLAAQKASSDRSDAHTDNPNAPGFMNRIDILSVIYDVAKGKMDQPQMEKLADHIFDAQRGGHKYTPKEIAAHVHGMLKESIFDQTATHIRPIRDRFNTLNEHLTKKLIK